jgi:hypothetical protein
MNSRERVIRAIEFESPDRIPIMRAFLPSAIRRCGEKIMSALKIRFLWLFLNKLSYETY